MNDAAIKTQRELEAIRTAALLAGASPEAAESAVRARIQQLLPAHMQAIQEVDWNDPVARMQSAQRWRDEHGRAMGELNKRDEQRRIAGNAADAIDDGDVTGMRAFVRQCF